MGFIEVTNLQFIPFIILRLFFSIASPINQKLLHTNNKKNP